jgi:hypothetical protein
VRVMDWDRGKQNDVVGEVVIPGTQFTCFTLTKSQIVTLRSCVPEATLAQVLSLLALQVQKYKH